MVLFLFIVFKVFQNLFPARGRKPSSFEFHDSELRALAVFQNLFPARGRKRLGITDL